MVRDKLHLNQAQVDVLSWVQRGCPDGVFTHGYQHRITARALEGRGLVSVSGRGSSWRAVITELGTAWLADPPTDPEPGDPEIDHLISRVLAEGEIEVPADRAVAERYERLVRRSLKSPRRPRGQRLAIEQTGRWGMGPRLVRFVEHVDDYVEVTAVPVAMRVGRYHPVARAYLDDKDGHFVTAEHLQRAARILHALAVEAERRGLGVVDPRSRRLPDDYEHRQSRGAHLLIQAPVGWYGLRIREIPARGGGKLDGPRWPRPKTTPAWLWNRSHEFIPSGRLEVVVDGPGTSYQGNHYRDAKSRRVEDKLGEVFRSFEIEHLRAEARERERQRQRDERLARWNSAMERARLAYVEDRRWRHFQKQEGSDEQTRRQRIYLARARVAVGSIEDGQLRQAAGEQLDFIANRLDSTDPMLDATLFIPRIDEPTSEDLAPFLDGWSPHGPGD